MKTIPYSKVKTAFRWCSTENLSWKFRRSHQKASVSDSFFIKGVGCRPAFLLIKHSGWNIFQNTYVSQHLWTFVSETWKLTKKSHLSTEIFSKKCVEQIHSFLHSNWFQPRSSWEQVVGKRDLSRRILKDYSERWEGSNNWILWRQLSH